MGDGLGIATETVLMPAGARLDARSAAALLVQSSAIPLALLSHGALHFANAAFTGLFHCAGFPAGESVRVLMDPADHPGLDIALEQAIRQVTTCVVGTIGRDGMRRKLELHLSPVAFDGDLLVAALALDITRQTNESAQLSLLAYSDPLTALANRALLIDRMRQVMVAARHGGSGFTVLALDLDGFKPVNDLYGHAAGDLLLQRIAQRLLAGVRETDTVARIGGDEFAVLLPGMKRPEDAATVAERLIEQVQMPVVLRDATIRVGVSVGAAIFPDHAGAVDPLLAAADAALYAAKRQGGGRFIWATTPLRAEAMPPPMAWEARHEVGVPEIDAQHARLAALLNELGTALRNAEPHQELLERTIAYTAFHFASEERLMRACGFRGESAHRAIHRRLLAEIRALRTDGDGISVSLVLRFLQEWLFRHVDGADRDLAAALLACRRIQPPPVITAGS